MKKQKKVKASKRSGKETTELPELVTIMAKLVERLDALERKTDLVLSRVSSSSQEVRTTPQNFRRPEAPPHHGSINQPGIGQGKQPQREGNSSRPMYDAVCADCRKSCEVPFRPTGERPVYCKECFARRKSGQGAQSQSGSNLSLRPSVQVSHPAFPEKKREGSPESKSGARGNKTPVKKKNKR